MGGRSSKTKPAASPVKTQDTVVETFDMGGVDGAAETETLKQDHIREIEETHSAHATNAHKGGTVHEIWEGRPYASFESLSHASLPLEWRKPVNLDLQVSSSEEEDDEPEGDETRHTAENRERPRKKKKPPKSLPASDKSKLTLSSLRPVKPLHPLSKQTPVERVKTPLPTVAADSDKPPSTPSQGQDMPTNKPESPSRFFGFKVRRNSIRSDASSTRENKTITGGASLERFIEWRDGTCRSSGRDSSTRNSETPEDDAEDQVEQSSDKVEDFDELERETASALSSPPPRTVRFMMLAKHIQTDQAKASEKRTPVPSPSMSVESQRSSRSGGRNLNTDNVDETIVNNILAEAIE
ncbi:hypothetical protein FI667_g4617, partial [Globisporangium splendens]